MTEVKEERVLATNRAAFHNYHISTKYEAGAALTGTEVKSVLDGRIQLKDSYVAIRDGMRFDVLSPVLVFRIQPVGTALVYETPGSFSAEETHFTYEIGAFEHDRLSIRVFSLQRDSASRATPKFQFEYAVENLDKRQPIDSFFYTGFERRRLLQKGR